MKRRQHRGRDRRIADAEIADAQEGRFPGDRLHAEGHGGRAAALVERGILGDVVGRQVQREIEDLQPDDHRPGRPG